MEPEVVRYYLLTVREFLIALNKMELVAHPDDVKEFERWHGELLRQTTMLTTQFPGDATGEQVKVPETPELRLSDDGTSVVLAIGQLELNLDREDDTFEFTWRLLAGEGMCDGWGSAEQKRVFREWVAEGEPCEIASFIEAHANRPVR